MSDLPSGWAESTLGGLADVLDHLRVPVNRVQRAQRVGDVPYYGATGQVGWIDEALFDEELCLLGEDGAPFLDSSKPKAYVIDGPSWVNNHAHVLRARVEVATNRFLKYALDQVDYGAFITGTTRGKLTKSAMISMPIALPPLAEQRRIVAAIEEQFSRLDACERALSDAKARAGRMKLLVLANAFDSKRDSVPLREMADVRLGRQRSPKNHFGSNMKPYLRAANVTWRGLSLTDVKEMHFSNDEARRYELLLGDILLAEASGSASEVGKPVTWGGEIDECCFQNTLIRVRSRGPIPGYLRLVFLHAALAGQFAQASPGVGIHHLGAGRLSDWLIPMCSESEQVALVEGVERLFSLIDSLSAAVESAQKRSAVLRRAILDRAFRGELVPQDPDDDPAGVLLERIVAQRAVVGNGRPDLSRRHRKVRREP